MLNTNPDAAVQNSFSAQLRPVLVTLLETPQTCVAGDILSERVLLCNLGYLLAALGSGPVPLIKEGQCLV